MPPPPAPKQGRFTVTKPNNAVVVEVKETEVEMVFQQTNPSLTEKDISNLNRGAASPRGSMRKRRGTTARNKGKLNLKESRATRQKRNAKMLAKRALDTAELNDVNIDMRVKAVEGMFEEGSANQSFYWFAKFGQAISYLMYLFLYLLSFPVVIPFCCRCCAQASQLREQSMRDFKKKYKLNDQGHYELTSETISRSSIQQELSYEGHPQSYIPDDGSSNSKWINALRDWEPFQQRSYEDFW